MGTNRLVNSSVSKLTFLTISTLIGRSSGSFLTQGLINIQQKRDNISSQNWFKSTRTTSIRKMATSGEQKRVLVPIGNDSEEIETTCITDTLARFGAEVITASVMPDGDLKCKMSRGINIIADITMKEAATQEWDLVALPGGMPGAEHLRDCAALISLLEKQNREGKLYSAICASPAVVLASKGLIKNGATCYPVPVFRSTIEDPSDEDVVVQGNLVTSKGPGTALKFSLKLGEMLYGKEAAKKIASEMLVEF